MSRVGVVLCLVALAWAGQVRAETPKEVNVVNMPEMTLKGTPTVRLAGPCSGSACSAFQAEAVLNMPGSATSGNVKINLPAGKRLVVQHIGLKGGVHPGHKLFDMSVTGFVGVSHATFHFRPEFSYSSPDYDWFLVNQPLTLYADTDSGLTFFVWKDVAGGATDLMFNVTGYLVDCPTG